MRLGGLCGVFTHESNNVGAIGLLLMFISKQRKPTERQNYDSLNITISRLQRFQHENIDQLLRQRDG